MVRDILTFQGGALYAPTESLMLQNFGEVREKSHEPCVLSFHNLDLVNPIYNIFSNHVCGCNNFLIS